MCVKCGFPGGAAEGMDPGALTWRDRENARAVRLSILQAILRPHGATVEESALASSLRLSSAGGEAWVSRSPDDLWPLVDRLLGAPLDPLAPCYTQTETAAR